MGVQLKINEIFYSIQGESLFAGKPTVFVRLSSCNLRCTYCDTRYSFWKGHVRSLEDVLAEVHKHPTKYVCVTGGEPLGQAGVYPLMQTLVDEGYTVSLETNGSFLVDKVPPQVINVLDLKTPDSGEAEANEWKNIPLLKPTDQIKFVVASRADFDWACEHVLRHALADKCTVLFSPVHGKVEPKDLADWVLHAPFPSTFQLQMHKEIWGAGTRGV
jgi:7-carboxy-7-deazaguanine synthase